MERVRYLSPTSLKTYQQNPKKFYIMYLSEQGKSISRPKQNQAMSIGSAFDAFLKSYVGNYDAVKLFEDQVEAENRDWAWENGKKVFEFYKECGALDHLLEDIEASIIEPVYEFDVIGKLKVTNDIVPLFGKPDMFLFTSEGRRIITDFKVNGYCSKSGVSPAKGYIRILPGGDRHKNCVINDFDGAKINSFYKMEEVNKDWAIQLATYAWMLGEPAPSDFIAHIEQIACSHKSKTPLRVATHKLQIGEEFQNDLKKQYADLWDVVQTWYDEELENMALQIKSDPELWDLIN